MPLTADRQDKRSLVPFELEDVERWLKCTVEDAKRLIRLTPVERFAAAPFLSAEGSASE